MIGPVQLARLIRINSILLKHGLTRPVVAKGPAVFRYLSYLNPWSFKNDSDSRGKSIRIALEQLGPIFVKFGQLLSTRRDLLPDDIADELAKLQDQVPPFPGSQAKKIIERELNKPVLDAFATFDETPLASASIAQVHAATLHDGSEVIIKVLRPDILKTIRHDIALMYFAAKITQRLSKRARRLRISELVAEFEQTIIDELDLMREAGNASQLRRNFENSPMMYVPKIYWPYARNTIMVMERIHGIRISDIDLLKAANTNMKKLAEYGVEIFFTQVLRDSFFHADMHPGNLFVDVHDPQNPKYLGVDFGIMGTLAPEDQHYLSANLLAFFQRDYRKVAVLHVESGWVPADTRVDQFESAIRTVCEPIFERPLKDISFGSLLLNLFRTAERFDMKLQPQLMLLQKTLLSIEGLGRQLYPDLDLWHTAKPFLEKFVRSQNGIVEVAKTALKNMPQMVEKLIKTPEILFDVLEQTQWQQRINRQQMPKVKPKRKNSKRSFLFGAGSTLAIGTIISLIVSSNEHTPISHWNWLTGGFALGFLVIGWAFPKK